MRILYYWGPAVVWMAIIFLLSHRQSMSVSPHHFVNFLFFKFLHVMFYAVLYVFVFRATRNTTKKHWVPMAVFISLIYAVTDELHQRFVPTREGKPRDVIIDAIGVTIAWYFLTHIVPRAPKRLRRWVASWQLTS